MKAETAALLIVTLATLAGGVSAALWLSPYAHLIPELLTHWESWVALAAGAGFLLLTVKAWADKTRDPEDRRYDRMQ